jgi:hypothetical protein
LNGSVKKSKVPKQFRSLIIPCIMYEATLSPGCTLAVIIIPFLWISFYVELVPIAPFFLIRDVMVSSSHLFPAKVLQRVCLSKNLSIISKTLNTVISLDHSQLHWYAPSCQNKCMDKNMQKKPNPSQIQTCRRMLKCSN